jgi:hypothetical protein
MARSTDETLMEALRRRQAPLAERLRQRRLYKRVLDLPATELPPEAGTWVADEPALTSEVEDRLAAECGRHAGELLLDFPRKPAMLASDVPVLTRRGTVAPARVGIQRVAEDLHTAARRLRVYAAEPCPLPAEPVLALVEGGADEVRARLRETRPLLAPA